jgi:hypothetical protein
MRPIRQGGCCWHLGFRYLGKTYPDRVGSTPASTSSFPQFARNSSPWQRQRADLRAAALSSLRKGRSLSKDGLQVRPIPCHRTCNVGAINIYPRRPSRGGVRNAFFRFSMGEAHGLEPQAAGHAGPHATASLICCGCATLLALFRPASCRRNSSNGRDQLASGATIRYSCTDV